VGLKNSDDVGLYLDLQANVYINGALVSTGQLNNVSAGGSGFNASRLNTITLPLASPVPAPSGATMMIDVQERSACANGRHGTARLWYNGQPVDSGSGRDAGSRFDATIGGSNNDYFLRGGFVLDTTAGSSRLNIDILSGNPCSPFKSFGTWTITLP
jgi:hypothetical protein